MLRQAQHDIEDKFKKNAHLKSERLYILCLSKLVTPHILFKVSNLIFDTF
jgi:hypothetical protein